MKRLVLSALTTLALTLGSTGVVMAGGPAIETFPVSFTITSAQCGNLASGTTITGSGSETSITIVRTDASGVTTIMNTSHAQGTATDDLGNTYVFNYSNSFRVSNSVADPDTFTGTMSDSFSLAGNGPAQLQNGFVAVLTTSDNFATATWQVLNSRGDPIGFAAGPIVAHCDPL